MTSAPFSIRYRIISLSPLDAALWRAVKPPAGLGRRLGLGSASGFGGARLDAVSKNGQTVTDMANGYRQRVQPYPATVALLDLLGARNTHKCVSC